MSWQIEDLMLEYIAGKPMLTWHAPLEAIITNRRRWLILAPEMHAWCDQQGVEVDLVNLKVTFPDPQVVTLFFLRWMS